MQDRGGNSEVGGEREEDRERERKRESKREREREREKERERERERERKRERGKIGVQTYIWILKVNIKIEEKRNFIVLNFNMKLVSYILFIHSFLLVLTFSYYLFFCSDIIIINSFIFILHFS